MGRVVNERIRKKKSVKEQNVFLNKKNKTQLFITMLMFFLTGYFLDWGLFSGLGCMFIGVFVFWFLKSDKVE